MTCGELVDVLKMKLAEFPGMNTVLRPEMLGNMRSGFVRCSRDLVSLMLEETLGKW